MRDISEYTDYLDRLADLDAGALRSREFRRILDHLGALEPGGWQAPTRCSEWTVRDLLGHLVCVEEYTAAGLDGSLRHWLASTAEQAAAQGQQGLDGGNAAGVRRHAATPTGELLAAWRRLHEQTAAALARLGPGGMIDTSVGPYPAVMQTFYLAVEYATHADDIPVPVPPAEQPARLAWQARFAREALRENGFTVTEGNRTTLAKDETAAELDDAELVAAVTARLAPDHPLPASLRAAMRCMA